MFPIYPYINVNDLNLDYLLRTVRLLEAEIKNFVNFNAIKYADPLAWNITTQYEGNTVVIDPATGIAYLSTQAVPNGVAITNTDYWTAIFDMSAFFADLGDVNDLLTTDKTSVVNAINEVFNTLALKTKGVLTPDMFSGSNDADKIQACIDYAIANYYPTIILDRNYDITGSTLKLNKGIYLSDTTYFRYRAPLSFIGIGECEIYKGDAGYIFSADVQSGYFVFTNIKFRGSANATASMNNAQVIALRKAACDVFDCSVLLYLNTANCNYQQLRNVFDGTKCVDTATNAQCINSHNDFCTYCNAFVTLQALWACNFDGARVENCNKGICVVDDDPAATLQVSNLNVRNCSIESTIEGPGIDFDSSGISYGILRTVNVIGCYFEDCDYSAINIKVSNAGELNICENHITNGSNYGISQATNNDTIFINNNTINSSTVAIYTDSPGVEHNYQNNLYDGTGSPTNSTAAHLSDIMIYEGSVTYNIASGSDQTLTIPISDLGGITKPKAVIFKSMQGTLYNFQFKYCVLITTETALTINIDNINAQDFLINYVVMGYK